MKTCSYQVNTGESDADLPANNKAMFCFPFRVTEMSTLELSNPLIIRIWTGYFKHVNHLGSHECKKKACVYFSPQRSLLSHVCECHPGHASYDQCDLVSWPRSSFLHHHPDVLTRTCQVPHSGHPLPDGMHHLWHQLQRQLGIYQPHRTQVRVQISWILIKWERIHTCIQQRKKYAHPSKKASSAGSDTSRRDYSKK